MSTSILYVSNQRVGGMFKCWFVNESSLGWPSLWGGGRTIYLLFWVLLSYLLFCGLKCPKLGSCVRARVVENVSESIFCVLTSVKQNATNCNVWLNLFILCPCAVDSLLFDLVAIATSNRQIALQLLHMRCARLRIWCHSARILCCIHFNKNSNRVMSVLRACWVFRNFEIKGGLRKFRRFVTVSIKLTTRVILRCRTCMSGF